MIGIIGGSGVYDPGLMDDIETRGVSTPFGEVDVLLGSFSKKEVAFLPRHGPAHSVPPHLINYRANIWALKSIGVDRIISTSASGSLKSTIEPGSCVILSNFIDFTRGRPSTFYDGALSKIDEKGVVHIDVTEPYCPELRSLLVAAGKSSKVPIVDGGVYVCTEGPRFETAAEIGMFSKLGGDVVGMTNVPEVTLARELEMCYASMAMVTNYAAGLSKERLTHTEVLEIMGANKAHVQDLLKSVVPLIPNIRSCSCGSLLSGAKAE